MQAFNITIEGAGEFDGVQRYVEGSSLPVAVNRSMRKYVAGNEIKAKLVLDGKVTITVRRVR